MDTKEKVSTSLDKENDKKAKSVLITVDENQALELKDIFYPRTGNGQDKQLKRRIKILIGMMLIRDIKQDKDSEECPHCLCRPCITDEERR